MCLLGLTTGAGHSQRALSKAFVLTCGILVSGGGIHRGRKRRVRMEFSYDNGINFVSLGFYHISEYVFCFVLFLRQGLTV
jgi:hypothetical protein